MSDYADNLRKSMTNATRRFMRMVQEMQEKDDAALREQVIRMAREAGLPYIYQTGEVANLGLVERFAALVAAAEREACAQLVTNMVDNGLGVSERIIAAIRARGEK